MEKTASGNGSNPDTARINREISAGEYRLGDLCKDLYAIEEIEKLLEERGLRSDFVTSTKVLVDDSRDFYMYVDDKGKRLVACLSHIQDSDPRIVYLDFLHELVHIFQLYDGRNLYDRRFKYVRRPTEIEAYAVAINEGRRIGMGDEELREYLRVEWISDEEHLELANAVGLDSRIQQS